MGVSITNHLTTLFVLSLILLGRSCNAGFLLKKAYVEIKNCMEGEATLSVSCKSKDDDLGRHDLVPRDSFSFRFRPDILGTTQFWCSFEWGGAAEPRHYDIYVQNRDYHRCTNCFWCIQPKGPCLFNPATNKYDLCDKWNVH